MSPTTAAALRTRLIIATCLLAGLGALVATSPTVPAAGPDPHDPPSYHLVVDKWPM